MRSVVRHPRAPHLQLAPSGSVGCGVALPCLGLRAQRIHQAAQRRLKGAVPEEIGAVPHQRRHRAEHLRAARSTPQGRLFRPPRALCPAAWTVQLPAPVQGACMRWVRLGSDAGRGAAEEHLVPGGRLPQLVLRLQRGGIGHSCSRRQRREAALQRLPYWRAGQRCEDGRGDEAQAAVAELDAGEDTQQRDERALE